MYLYGKEIELVDYFLVKKKDEQVCDKCKEAEKKQELRECLEKHCGKGK